MCAASVGIALEARRTAADRSVPGGPALGLDPAGGGDAGVGGDRGPFPEDAHRPDGAAQTIVDHSAGGRGLRGDSNRTAFNGVTSRSVIPARLTSADSCSSPVDLTVGVDAAGGGRALG